LLRDDSRSTSGELGFQEFETSKYLVGILRANDFTVRENVAGIPTAWVATWGSGKPVIALGSDLDGIPQASQILGVACHLPLVAGAPGHGEGAAICKPDGAHRRGAGSYRYCTRSRDRPRTRRARRGAVAARSTRWSSWMWDGIFVASICDCRRGRTT